MQKIACFTCFILIVGSEIAVEMPRELYRERMMARAMHMTAMGVDILYWYGYISGLGPAKDVKAFLGDEPAEEVLGADGAHVQGYRDGRKKRNEILANNE